jgi:hypothetical protein
VLGGSVCTCAWLCGLMLSSSLVSRGCGLVDSHDQVCNVFACFFVNWMDNFLLNLINDAFFCLGSRKKVRPEEMKLV